MPYYSGDYYQGDYYQGDNYGGYAAGGFSLKKLFTPPKAIRGLLEGLPLVGTVLKAGQALGGALQPGRAPVGISGFTGPDIPVQRVPGIRGLAERIVPGGATGYMIAGKKRRRLNPLNISALRRAMRRAKGFEKQARRVGSFFRPGFSYRLKGRRPRKSK